MLASMTGTKFVHVPFKGTAPALVALLGAQVDFQIADVAAIPHVRAGKLRALAVTTARRSALVPEIPTVAESGVPGFDVPSATGILAPAGTPTDVVAKINASINRARSLRELPGVRCGSSFRLRPRPGRTSWRGCLRPGCRRAGTSLSSSRTSQAHRERSGPRWW